MADMETRERRALEMWQEREMRFPKFVRRMRPDHFDRVSGAWDAMLEKASTPPEDTGHDKA